MKPVTSVIICAHNPRPHYFQRVLNALRDQTLPLDQWELFLIDNASETALARDWDLSWHPQSRHVHQQELGLASARQRGIREALAGLLVFVDDDNVLDADYLVEALRIGREWPQLGVFGGSIKPEFEVDPPTHLHEFLGALALREIEAPRWTNIMPCVDATPWGAGLCVRANVARAYMAHCDDTAIVLSDRRGKDLISGGDAEISYVAGALGLGMGLFPELNVLHLIPSERINEDYLVKISEGIGTAGFLLAYKWCGQFPRSYYSGLGLLRFIRGLLRSRGLRRRMLLAEARASGTARKMICHSLSRPSAGRKTVGGLMDGVR
jgi:glycosyltransferase involved in cell wall biosynthesis